jgi:hypothetical protein
LVDAYLIYASTALVVMGSSAIALSIIFRWKLNKIDSVSRDSTPNVFNKSFVVFDPYQTTTIFHRFLLLLPFVPLICGFALAALLLVIIDSGLLLTLIMVVLALSLMVVEESPEAYTQSTILIRAIQGGSKLGVGDMKLLQATKKLLPRLSIYYLGVSIFLLALAALLPYVWSSALWCFAVFIGYMLQASVTAGPTTWMTAIFLYAVVVSVIAMLAGKAKNRLFGHHSEHEPL